MKPIASPAPLRVAAMLAALTAPAFAHAQQAHAHAAHAAHVDGSEPEAATQKAPADPHATHAAHTAESTEPREPIPAYTAQDLADAFPPVDHHAMQHADGVHRKLTFNRLEAWDADTGTGQAWEGSLWVGDDLHRLHVRSEGEHIGGHTEQADVELLCGRSVSPWWDVVAGVKHDLAPGDARTWAAIGVQGLAPYRFELAATVYAGDGGQIAANVEVEYTLRITNRLILQPLLELDLSAKDDADHRDGRGLQRVEAGLRLRYEITRRFAPYVGVSHERAFGATADYRSLDGESARDTRLVAGVRVWF